jgi:PAS domain S-box-containing protein
MRARMQRLFLPPAGEPAAQLERAARLVRLALVALVVMAAAAAALLWRSLPGVAPAVPLLAALLFLLPAALLAVGQRHLTAARRPDGVPALGETISDPIAPDGVLAPAAAVPEVAAPEAAASAAGEAAPEAAASAAPAAGAGPEPLDELQQANLRLTRELEAQRQAASSSGRSEQAYRLLLDSIPAPVLAVDERMNIQFCNEAYAGFVGATVEELQGANLVTRFPSIAGTRTYTAYLRALETGQTQEVEGPVFDRYERARVFRTPQGIMAIAEDITERRQIEAERERFTQLLRTAAETTQSLSAILEPSRLLDQTVEMLHQRFGLYHVHLYLLDERRRELVVRAGSGAIGRKLSEQGHSIPLEASQSIVARAARRQEIVVVSDVTLEPSFLPNPLLPETRSEVAVPLVARGSVLGVLDVQDSRPNRFTPADLDTFSVLAGQIAVALENARRFDEQHRVEQELRRMQRRLDRLFEHMPHVVLYETGGGREYISDNVIELLGYPRGAFEDDRAFFPTLFHPDDREPQLQRVDVWAREGRPGVLQLEFRCRRADGDYIWLQDYMVAISPEHGQPYMSGVLVDVTARKAVEEERIRFTNQLRTAAELAERLSAILSPQILLDQTVELLQQRFDLYHVHLYLFDRATASLVVRAGSGDVGRVLCDLEHTIPLDAPQSIVARAGRRREIIRVDDVRREPTFLPNPFLPETRSELAVPLWAQGQLLGVLDVQDNRPDRFAQSDVDTFSILAGQIAIALANAHFVEEIQETAARLREVDRLKSEFVANMSHELRTPLNSVIGYAELLLMGMDGQLDPETRQDIQAIYDNGQHLLSLINDLLDLAKIEAGHMRLELVPVDLAPLLEEVRLKNAGLLHQKPVTLTVEAEADLPAVLADRLRLAQILNNLIANAVKFTPEGTIWLRARRDGSEVALDVEDTGVGMGAEDLQTIFEKFRQGEGLPVRRAEGTGLGLSITHHLVQLHGGRLDVRSTPGVGSVFTVRLPVRPPEPAPPAPLEPAAGAAT